MLSTCIPSMRRTPRERYLQMTKKMSGYFFFLLWKILMQTVVLFILYFQLPTSHRYLSHDCLLSDRLVAALCCTYARFTRIIHSLAFSFLACRKEGDELGSHWTLQLFLFPMWPTESTSFLCFFHKNSYNSCLSPPK